VNLNNIAVDEFVSLKSNILMNCISEWVKR